MSLPSFYVRGIYRGFNRQGLEFRARLEAGRTKRNTTQVLNIIQKVPGTVFQLKVLIGEGQRGVAQKSKSQEDG